MHKILWNIYQTKTKKICRVKKSTKLRIKFIKIIYKIYK